MKEIKEYKIEAKKLFFLLVDKDIDTWSYNYSKSEIRSKYYKTKDDKNSSNFKIYLSRGVLCIETTKTSDIRICKYKMDFLILNYKIFFYVIKIKKHLKQKEKKIIYNDEIDIFDTAINRITDNYKSEIRKEKLIKLDN